MRIHTYGNPKDPVVLLIHPMLITGEQMYEHFGKKLPGKYCFITTDQAGHGEDTSVFAPRKDALELKQILQNQGIKEVELLYAASMGGLTAMPLLSLGELKYKTVHLDGIPLGKSKGIKRLLSIIGYLAARKKAVTDPSSLIKTLSPVYGDELGMSMAKQMGRLSAKNVVRIIKACLNGCGVPVDPAVCGSLTFEWGDMEVNRINGEPLAKRLYPWSKVLIIQNSRHCERLGKESESLALEIRKEMDSWDKRPANNGETLVQE